MTTASPIPGSRLDRGRHTEAARGTDAAGREGRLDRDGSIEADGSLEVDASLESTDALNLETIDQSDPSLNVALPSAPMPAAGETAGPVSGPGRGPVPRHVARHLVSGTSALGAGILVERGMGFTANILAARFGGTATFGAYALAISTANNISTYAAGQIGSTAARFSGKYQHGTPGYTTLARALVIVSVVSAALAATALWFGAAPIAHLLGKGSLTGLLRWAALSAVGIVLLECARGFFTGQRRLKALVLLSGVVGVGMVSLVPMFARGHSPVRMIMAQGAITTGAVVVCLVLGRPLGLRQAAAERAIAAEGPVAPAPVAHALPLRPMLREVWSFGFVQLAGLVAANLAGWWVMTMVARADTSLAEMGFFSVASQLRNMVGLVPGMVTEGSYAIMADPEGEKQKTPQGVMALGTFVATFASLALASVAIAGMPVLLHVYGASFAGAAVPCAIALAVAVAHMGNAPAAARLSIVSIRSTGVINTVWAVSVAVAGTVFLLHGGNAARALTVYLAAHVLSAVLVLLVLARRDGIPAGMLGVFGTGTLTVTSLAALATWRAEAPALVWPLTGAMLLLTVAALGGLMLLGRRHHWLPSAAAVRRLLDGRFGRAGRVFGRAPGRGEGEAAHV